MPVTEISFVFWPWYMFTKNTHLTFLSETIASQIRNLDENRREITSSFFQFHCSAQYLHPDRGSDHVSIVRWWELWKLWEVFPPQGSSAGQPRPVLVKVWRWNLGSQDHLDHLDHLDHHHDLALHLIFDYLHLHDGQHCATCSIKAFEWGMCALVQPKEGGEVKWSFIRWLWYACNGRGWYAEERIVTPSCFSSDPRGISQQQHVAQEFCHWIIFIGPELKFRQDLKLEFGQYFAADALYVEVMKLNLGRDSEARFGQDFEF